MTSKEAMQDVERALGRALADDQASAAERHIRDGRVGQWQGWFTGEQLQAVEERLAKFGLSLAEFGQRGIVS
jgi:hypothetical protein